MQDSPKAVNISISSRHNVGLSVKLPELYSSTELTLFWSPVICFGALTLKIKSIYKRNPLLI